MPALRQWSVRPGALGIFGGSSSRGTALGRQIHKFGARMSSRGRARRYRRPPGKEAYYDAGTERNVVVVEEFVEEDAKTGGAPPPTA